MFLCGYPKKKKKSWNARRGYADCRKRNLCGSSARAKHRNRNDTYGRYRMYKALKLKHQDDSDFYIPGERTIYRIMETVGLVHRPKRNPHGITKADKNARKSDDKLQRDFKSDEPLKKCITNITEIKGSDGKLYVSALFDCFDVTVLGLAMDTNMKAPLCVATLENA